MTDCTACGTPTRYLVGVRKLRKQIDNLERNAKEQKRLIKEAIKEMRKVQSLNKGLKERSERAEGKLSLLRDAIGKLREMA